MSSASWYKKLRENLKFSQARVSRVLVAIRAPRNRISARNNILIGFFKYNSEGIPLGTPANFVSPRYLTKGAPLEP